MNSQTNIWYSPMNTSSTEWSIECGPTYTISSTDCPTGGSHTSCWHLSNESIISRTVSTVRFINVELTFSYSTDATIGGNGRCIIDFSINNGSTHTEIASHTQKIYGMERVLMNKTVCRYD